jgi:PAS domain S-box-containing protein
VRLKVHPPGIGSVTISESFNAYLTKANVPTTFTRSNFPLRVLDHASSMLAYWDRHLVCRYANSAYETWFGKHGKLLIGSTLPELLGAEIFALNAPYVRAVLLGHPQVFERAITGPDGVCRHSLAHYHPDIVDGAVVGFIAEVSDVSMLKELQIALQDEVAMKQRTIQALARKDALLEAAQALGELGSWKWERDADITTWSSGLYRLFGYDPGQLPPSFSAHASLYTPPSWSRLQEAVVAALTHGHPYVLELEYYRPDGTKGWMEARGEVERDSAGAIVGIFGTVRDITEHTTRKEALRALVAELTQRDTRKDEFLSTLGHELRNCIAPLSAGLQLLQIKAPASGGQQVETVMARQLAHAARLVDDIFDLRRMQIGALLLQRSPVSLNAVVSEAVDMCAPALAQSSHSLTVAVPPLDVWVDGDPVRLTQAFVNVLSNACKFTPPQGSIAVTLRADGPGHALFIVRDSGIGMSAAELDTVFGLFVRSGAGVQHAPEGLGIGLHLVKQLVQCHGGTVTATSAGPGQGSTLTIRLPRLPS